MPQSYYSVMPSGNTVADHDLDEYLCAEMFEEEFDFTVMDQSSYANTIMASPMTIGQSAMSPFKKKSLMNSLVSYKADTRFNNQSVASPAMLQGMMFGSPQESRVHVGIGQESPEFQANTPLNFGKAHGSAKVNPRSHLNNIKPIINLLPIGMIEEELDQEFLPASVEIRESKDSLEESSLRVGAMTSPNKKNKNYVQGFGIFKSSARDLEEHQFDVLSKIDKLQKPIIQETAEERIQGKKPKSDQQSVPSVKDSPNSRHQESEHSVTEGKRTDEKQYLAELQISKIATDNLKVPSSNLTENSCSDKQKALSFVSSPEVNAVDLKKVPIIGNIESRVSKDSLTQNKITERSQNRSDSKVVDSPSTEVPGNWARNLGDLAGSRVLGSPSIGFSYTPKDGDTTKSRGGYSVFSQGITPAHKTETAPSKFNKMLNLRHQLVTNVMQQQPLSHRSMHQAHYQAGRDQFEADKTTTHSTDPYATGYQIAGDRDEDVKLEDQDIKEGSRRESKFGMFSANLKKIMKQSTKSKPKTKCARRKDLNSRAWGSRNSSTGHRSTDPKHSEDMKNAEPVQRHSQTSNISDVMHSLNMAPVKDSCNFSVADSNKNDARVSRMLEDVKEKISKVELMVSKLSLFPYTDARKTAIDTSGLMRSSIQVSKSCRKALAKVSKSPSKGSIISNKKSPIQGSKPLKSSVSKKTKTKQTESSLVVDLQSRPQLNSLQGSRSPSPPSQVFSPSTVRLAPPSRVTRKDNKNLIKDSTSKSISSLKAANQAATRVKLQEPFFSPRDDVSIYEPAKKKVTVNFSQKIGSVIPKYASIDLRSLSSKTNLSSAKKTLLSGSVLNPSKPSGISPPKKSHLLPTLGSTSAGRRAHHFLIDRSPLSLISRLGGVAQKPAVKGKAPAGDCSVASVGHRKPTREKTTV